MRRTEWAADIAAVLLAVPAIAAIVGLVFLAKWYWGM